MRELEYNFTYREKDKGFQVILSYKDSKGRWKQKSKQGFKTKKLAKIAGDKLLDEVKEKTASEIIDEALEGITFKQLADLFMKENEPLLEYETILVYQSALKQAQALWDLPVTEISHMNLAKLINEMSVAASSKKTYFSKIKRIFNYAVSPCKIILTNPCAGVTIPKDKRQKKIKTLSNQEFLNLLDYARKESYETYIKLALAGYAGLRYSEILGLTWNDINFKTMELTVSKQYGRTGKGQYKMKSTKSMNGYRTIPIPVELTKILLQYKKSVPLQINSRLFADVSNNSTAVNSIISGGGYTITIHGLRHTYASRLVANGVDVKTVAALIGDTVETVIKTYVHYTDEMRSKAKEDIIKIFA
ncbi:site-specific integrase [Megasphaera stantonii]|uniref:site-specific integrase n=1 Tax=Megasphaera stantonii TaxID=2144175 RepID=UPI001D28A95B|nr:site-specific integrase [Megasphaera stantonii]HJE82955.1 site-specific integrase [Megasphaera stantonii]